MPNELTDIAITHISLVKQGANGKTFIYKSAQDEGSYAHMIDIKKTDTEQGIVYGIVYAPGEIDSQGDFADAEEIKKAAYNFMKALNAKNIDVEHSFNNTDAFVAESWLTKAGDPVFADEPEGSWAVAVKLESETLKKAARKGELKGLSMAGSAHKTPVEKAEEPQSKFQNLFAALADAASGVWLDFGTHIEKNKGENISQEFADQIKKKLLEATAKASHAIQHANEVQAAKITALEKSLQETEGRVTELHAGNEALTKENEALMQTNETLTKEIEGHSQKIETLEKDAKEVQDTLKKSSQDQTPKPAPAKKTEKGVV